MGSLLLPKYLTDSHEWAQCFYKEMLPMPLHGPIVALEKYCQWPQMGSVFLQRIAADALKWPIITAKNAAETLAWAHYYSC